MSAIDRFASATANPLLVASRLLLGLFLIWLGLTKLVPGWGNYDVDAVQTMQAFTYGKLDGQIGLYLIGGWQVLTGLAVCIIPALRLAIVLLWLLLALYVVLVAFHLPALFEDGLPTPFAAMTLRNALLTFVALAIASYSLKAAGPATKKAPAQ